MEVPKQREHTHVMQQDSLLTDRVAAQSLGCTRCVTSRAAVMQRRSGISCTAVAARRAGRAGPPLALSGMHFALDA